MLLDDSMPLALVARIGRVHSKPGAHIQARAQTGRSESVQLFLHSVPFRAVRHLPAKAAPTAASGNEPAQ